MSMSFWNDWIFYTNSLALGISKQEKEIYLNQYFVVHVGEWCHICQSLENQSFLCEHDRVGIDVHRVDVLDVLVHGYDLLKRVRNVFHMIHVNLKLAKSVQFLDKKNRWRFFVYLCIYVCTYFKFMYIV